MSSTNSEDDWKVICIWTLAIPVLIAYNAGSYLKGRIVRVSDTCAYKCGKKVRSVSRYMSKKRETALERAPQRFRTPPIFPNFCKLPYEIRAEIWRYACEAPRIVEIKPSKITRRSSMHFAGHCPSPWISPTAAPVGLWVCQESRKETLRQVELSFGRDGFAPQIYVNFERDSIFFRELPDRDAWLGTYENEEGEPMGRNPSLMKIRSLAVACHDMFSFTHILREMKNDVALSEVVLVNGLPTDKPVELERTPMWTHDWIEDESASYDFPYLYMAEVREELASRMNDSSAGDIPVVRCMEFVRKGRKGGYRAYDKRREMRSMPINTRYVERGRSLQLVQGSLISE
jgi:hypothetical protein